MLLYFQKQCQNDDVKIICLQLEKLKNRITNGDYDDPFKEFNECDAVFAKIKSLTINTQNEYFANATAIYQVYFQLFCNLSFYFQLLEQHDFKSSWDILQNCFDCIKTIGRFVDVDKRMELPSINQLLLEYEKLYPYRLFASSEFVISKSHCSICGKSMQSLACPHIKGNLYFGEFAKEVVDEIKELQAICLVQHPEDKRCVLEMKNNTDENSYYSKINMFLNKNIPRLQLFSIESHIETRKNESIIKVGPNKPCSCGSGIKFKKCCGLKINYHYENNIITLKNKLHFSHLDIML